MRCGGSTTAGAEQIEEFVERRRADVVGRYAATSVKLMMDGVLENYTGAMLEPYLDRHGAVTDNRGLLQIDPEGLAIVGAAAGRARVPAALPRDRRPGGPRLAGRGRGRAPGQRDVRHAAAHRPHPGHPPRRHPAVPRARRGGQCPAALGGPRGPDGRADDPVPRRAVALAVPVPLACGPPAPSWRWARTGASRARTRSGRWRSRSSAARPTGIAGGEVFLPDERLELIDALAAFTVGSAYVNHLDDDTGSLEVGKFADLAILDRDLFDRGAGWIGEATRGRHVRRGRGRVRGRRPGLIGDAPHGHMTMLDRRRMSVGRERARRDALDANRKDRDAERSDRTP